jgi:cold shock CspA family protein
MVLTVSKYIPKELYGFLEGAGQRVFFHLSEFDPLGGPPPIIGEQVEVGQIELVESKSYRARSVRRVLRTEHLTGTVTRFDHRVGYGFVTVGREQFFLHRSDLLDGSLPLVGAVVEFYVAGSIRPSARPRACHARLLRGT